jgi:hypothetical protein
MTYADIQDIQRRARDGDAEAQMALARVFDGEGRHDIALEWLRKAAQSGHAPSLTALGARLLVGKAAPQDRQSGAALLAAAAEAGSGEAAGLVAVCAAAAIGRPQSWSIALDYLQMSAELGFWRAREQLAVLTPDPAHQRMLLDASPAMPIPWKDIRQAIDLKPLLQIGAHEKIEKGPRIAVFKKFLPDKLCAWAIGRAQPKLAQARVVDPHGPAAFTHDARANTGMGFSFIETDVILQIIHTRLALASGVGKSQHEPTNILHYAVGQSYERHYDFFNPEAPNLHERALQGGQRIATFLIYLNDEYEGGETDFPEIGWRFRGARGDGLMFMNVNEDGSVDPRTLHAGLAPTRGEKWLLSKWMRDRDVPLV